MNVDNLGGPLPYFNHTNAGFVAGTTTTYTSTVTTTCSIKGKFATTLAAQTNTASPTTDAATGAAFVPVAGNNCCTLVIGTNAAGAIKYVQGPIIPTQVGVITTVGAFDKCPQWPALPDDFCACAYTIVRSAPSLASPGMTIGTTAWAATSVSCTTFKNVSQLPDRPQIA